MNSIKILNLAVKISLENAQLNIAILNLQGYHRYNKVVQKYELGTL